MLPQYQLVFLYSPVLIGGQFKFYKIEVRIEGEKGKEWND